MVETYLREGPEMVRVTITFDRRIVRVTISIKKAASSRVPWTYPSSQRCSCCGEINHTYYIEENTTPSGYKHPSQRYVLTVNEKGYGFLCGDKLEKEIRADSAA